MEFGDRIFDRAVCSAEGDAVAADAAVSSISVKRVLLSDIDDAFRAAWRAMERAASEPNVFYESWFLEPALRNLPAGQSIELFTLWRGAPGQGELLALWPFSILDRFGRWPVRHVQNWRHHNCFLGTPLVRLGHEHDFWNALLNNFDGDASIPGFLHIDGLTIGGPIERALTEICGQNARRCDIVLSHERAMLQSDLGPDQYFQQTVRTKKRKELRRQRRRLEELGSVELRRHDGGDDLDAWLDDFLRLEQSGWKGEAGSALGSSKDTRDLFLSATKAARAAGKLCLVDLLLDGRPIGMLVNYLSPPGGFGFKTAFDEEYSRFSPGVLLQVEHLKILENETIEWMDSCAAQDHPMIDALWNERRTVARISVELSGRRRKAIFALLRLGEDMMARMRGRDVPVSSALFVSNLATPEDTQ